MAGNREARLENERMININTSERLVNAILGGYTL